METKMSDIQFMTICRLVDQLDYLNEAELRDLENELDGPVTGHRANEIIGNLRKKLTDREL